MKSFTKYLAIILSAAAAAVLCSSCVTTPEKNHVYDYGHEEDVSNQPWVRPESFEGNAMGNMPQSR